MSNYLNQTRAKRKENYDFLNQIMQDNKINFENLISPKNESITSSQMTDQIIKIVNRSNPSPISNREPQNSISNRYTENQSNEQEEQDIPIINEIDNIIDRIKHKYSNFDHKQLTDQKLKSPIKQQDQNEDDVLKQIKQKIKNEQQPQPQAHGRNLPTKEQHIQQLNQVQIKQSEKKTQSILDVQQQRSSPTKGSQNKSNEGSSMKKEIKRLKETFKVSKPPLSQKSEDQDRQQIQDATFFPVQTESNEALSNNQPPTDQITNQFQQENLQTENYTTTPLKTEEEIHYQYSTPHKRDEIYSQLSYSQSQISQSNNKSYFNNPQTNSKQTIHDFDDDPIIQALVKEEVQLLQRLQYLQDQLKNQFI